MILIYSNTGEWGGVDVLIARFADHLLVRGIDFRILEPKSGRLRTQVPERVFIDFSQVEEIAGQITHVLFPSVSKLRDPMVPWKALAHANALAWIVHANDVFRCFFPLSGLPIDLVGYHAIRPLRAVLRAHASVFDSFFSDLINSDGLIVMDGATLRTLHYFIPGLVRNPELVPIPAHISEPVFARRSDGVLKVGYLGRMDSMKWSAVKPFVCNQLAPLSKARPVEFILVTEGDKVASLEALCRRLKIACTVWGYMPNEQARNWISAQTDLVVAMGTSALDLAGAGHPSVVLDPAAGRWPRKQEKFRFVQETSDFTLGEFRDFPGYVKGVRSFEECASAAMIADAASAGREYVATHHNPVVCFDNLLQCLRRSTLSIAELGRSTDHLLRSFQAAKRSPFRAAMQGSLGSWV